MPLGLPRLRLSRRRFLQSSAAFAGAVLTTHRASSAPLETLRLDYAYYNPVALVLKEKGWADEEFGKTGTKVEWVLSLGSNKALEFLNGAAVDFGSSAGSAALMARANDIPIKAVYIYSRPEWTALVTTKDSPIHKVEDLRGKRVAVTRGTDPHIFLLRALDRFGLSTPDIKMVLLQHPDGKTALVRGDVDAWAGLDPYMAQTELEDGSRLFFRDPNLNTYGFLNTREVFAHEHPDEVLRVLQVYERGRQWALANPDGLRDILAKAAKLTAPVAAKELERTDLRNPVIGEEHRAAIIAAGGVLKKAEVVPASTDIPAVAGQLIDTQFVTKLGLKAAAK
ncbi:MAG TPA: aliphatic sulfonate ABC transporter substrate-binding protein [Stellaceae bacterium]|jgi:sulfonate transport system substrate-binding protein|nr:aliphatic sulfonate ABC transporter substrate-binding protein [Stellaceae bacterium]